jgi:hypothetical protein
MIGMNMITKICLALTLIFSFAAISFTPLAYAACASNVSTKEAIECGAGEASGNNETPANASERVNSTVTKLLNLFSAIVGIIAVIMLIVGGFRYVTSGGNEQSTKSARDTILYALIGLVIVALAQIIVKFVISNAG